MRRLRRILTFFIALLPASRIKNLLLNMLSHQIDRTARFGPNIVLGLCTINIGRLSLVRAFNVFRDVDLSMGDDAIIGSWNWFSAALELRNYPAYTGKVQLGNSAAINSRNYFDCSGGITFGALSSLAGVRSTFITHFKDTKINKQTCKSIQIGERTMLSSNIKVTPGAVVGARSTVAMGSVLIAEIYPSGSLIAGVPGKVKGSREGLWFDREVGIVHSDE